MTQLLDIKLNAFTLLELLVTLAVIGIVAAVGAPYGVSRVCDARHNALASGIYTELSNARLFALHNNRYTRVNIGSNANNGLSIYRFYSTVTQLNCGIDANGNGSQVLSRRDFDAIEAVGMFSSYFCFSNEGMLEQSNYNQAALVDHRCGSRDYGLRVNFIGKAGFFILEENLPAMQAGSWRAI